MVTRRRSIAERKQRGLIAQGRVRQALGQITDPGLRRAVDALTSLDNWDEQYLAFTSDGKLTIDEEAIRDLIDPDGPLSFEDGRLTLTLDIVYRQATSASKVDRPIEIKDSSLMFTQFPARDDEPQSSGVTAGTSPTLADYNALVDKVNLILEDQRRAGHRRRSKL